MEAKLEQQRVEAELEEKEKEAQILESRQRGCAQARTGREQVQRLERFYRNNVAWVGVVVRFGQEER